MKALPLLAILKMITISCNFTQKKKTTNKRKKTAGAKQNEIVEMLLNC